MIIGGYEHIWGTEFIASFLIALAVVFFFGLNTFHQPTHSDDGEIPKQMLPRYLATHQEFSRAHALYVTSLMLFLVLAVLAGPRLLPFFEGDAEGDSASLPLVVALVIVGSTSVPWISKLEWQIRKFAHERAFIPEAVRKLTDQLSAAAFDFSVYYDDLQNNAPSLSGVERDDFDERRGTVQYRWAKLCCLTHKLKQLRSSDMLVGLEPEVLRRYGQDVDAIVFARNEFQPRVQALRNLTSSVDAESLLDDLRKVLRRVYLLLSCALRAKTGRNSDVSGIVRPFGFVLPANPGPKSGMNIVLTASALIFVSVLAVTFAAVVVNDLTTLPFSPYFPRTFTEPFMYAFSAALLHAAGMAAAALLRRRRVASGKWFYEGRPHSSNYVRSALVAAASGYAAAVLWSSFIGYPQITLALFKTFGPLALLPAVTGTWYVWYLDREVVLEAQVPRSVTAIVEGIVLSLLSFVVMTASYSVLTSEMPWDAVLFSGMLGLTIGSILGYYIPGEVAKDNSSSQFEWKVCTAALMREAEQILGSPHQAEEWLLSPNGRLEGATPSEVAKDRAGFERAWRALRSDQSGIEAVAA